MPNPDHDRSNLDEVRRNVLKNNYDRLVRQYTETADKAALSLNPSARIALEEEANNLYQRAEAADEELRQLDSRSPSSTPNQKTIAAIDSVLSSIDFSLAKQILANIVVPWENKGGCAAFLLQKSFYMRGDLLILEIQKLLAHGMRGYGTGSNLKPYRICLEDQTGLSTDRVGILERLCRDLGLNSRYDSVEALEAAVIETLCRPLRGTTTLLLEIGPWDEIPEEQQQALLDWFLQDFWISVVQQQNQVADKFRGVQCIAIVYSNDDLPVLCQDLCYFPASDSPIPIVLDFNPPKLIHLPLELWTELEIHDWLEKQGYSINDCAVNARKIHQKSGGGSPRTVHDLLNRMFQQPIAN